MPDEVDNLILNHRTSTNQSVANIS